LSGAGRARVLLAIAWARDARGETAQLAGVAAKALELAREVGDKSAEADARCLEGDVWSAKGQLAAAQAAYSEYLAIFQKLTEQDPANIGWQRELAMAHGRVGKVRQAQRQLDAAQAAFLARLTINRHLVEKDAHNAGSKRSSRSPIAASVRYCKLKAN
jgi:tetratricopeptide (TPR) repeat protein